MAAGSNDDRVPARTIGVLFGYSDGSNCQVVCASLISGDVTITIPGISDTVISISAIGTDSGDVAKPQAGYVGDGIVSGLLPFTQYSYVAIQGSNSESGKFYTAPRILDDFSIYFNTCDKAYELFPTSGYYSEMREQIESGDNPPCVANLVVDDNFGYVEKVDWIADDSAHTSTGTPNVTHKLYDYALAYLGGMGLFGSYFYGTLKNRLWCLNNINYIPQWGDHEFINNIGLSGGTSNGWGLNAGILPNPMHTSVIGDFLGAAYRAWAAFLKPLQPPTPVGAVDTGTNLWQANYGALNIVAPDAITNARSTTPSSGYGDLTKIFGNQQIDDTLNALDTAHSFKMVAMPYSTKQLTLPFQLSNQNGQKHTIQEMLPAEYNRLFRAKVGSADAGTEKSIMANTQTNGLGGICVFPQGDYHHMQVSWNQELGDADNEDEGYMLLCAGTVNASPLMPGAEGGTGISGEGNYYPAATTNVYMEFDPGWYASGNSGWNAGGLRFDIYGSKNFPELVCTATSVVYEDEWLEGADKSKPRDEWTRKWVQYVTGNRGVVVSSDTDQAVGVTAVGDLSKS